MSNIELFAFFGAPAILAIGATLLAWQNHWVMRRARERDASAVRHQKAPRSVADFKQV